MSPLLLYRDDGPIALAFGRLGARGRWVRRAPWLFALVAAAPPAAVAASDLRPGVLMAAIAWGVVVGGLTAGAPHDGPLDWLAVPLLRGAEYAVLALTGLAVDASRPLVFALICVLAMRDYDMFDRVRMGLTTAADRTSGIRLLALGWDGRLLVAGVAAVSDHGPGVYVGLTAYLGAVFVMESALGWIGNARALGS